MHRRSRNALLFAGSLMGSGLLLAAIDAFLRDNDRAWLYLIGAIAAFALGIAPGRRLRDRVSPPDA